VLSVETIDPMMELIAVVRPSAAAKTVRALERVEQIAFTRWRAYGRGRQFGITIENNGDRAQIEWLSKIVFTIMAPADRGEAVIQAIIDANQTQNVGDGMIFVCPIDEEISIRTGGRRTVVAEA